MNKRECEFYNNGKCERFGEHGTCEDARIENLLGYEGHLLQRTMLECCKTMSPYGNGLYFITDADIAALKEGKWLSLADDDEYGNFIKYAEE